MMGKKEGIVVSVEGKYANLLTPYGEFIKVNCSGKKLYIGEKFEGDEVLHRLSFFYTRKIIAAACIIFVLLVGGGVKAYYTPAATVLVNINPSIELKVNFLNKIISFKGLNGDGNKILSEVKINNDNINDALKIIIDQAKKDKFIDKNYAKTISIDIRGKNIDVSGFKSNMASSNLSVKIETNGNIILNNKPKDNSTNKNLNSSDKAAAKENTPSSEKHLSDKKEDKKLNNSISSENKFKNESNSSSVGNSSSESNSSSYKEKDKGESNVKQPQDSNNSKVKENQNSNKKTEENMNSKQNDNSNKDNSHQQNSNVNKKK
ncbi:anti-sigma factor domain-containing protein [Clostridium ragsdalei]|nr:anti-sigma factor domain-containing protein [Clostridium ragsdalei]